MPKQRDVTIAEAFKDLIALLDVDYDDLAAIEFKPQDKTPFVRVIGKDRSMRTRRFEVIE